MDKPAEYKIKVGGRVPERWIDYLGGLQIVENTPEGTVLEGWLPDQAALSGALGVLYNLRLPLLEVSCLSQPKRSNPNRSRTSRT